MPSAAKLPPPPLSVAPIGVLLADGVLPAQFSRGNARCALEAELTPFALGPVAAEEAAAAADAAAAAAALAAPVHGERFAKPAPGRIGTDEVADAADTNGEGEVDEAAAVGAWSALAPDNVGPTMAWDAEAPAAAAKGATGAEGVDGAAGVAADPDSASASLSVIWLTSSLRSSSAPSKAAVAVPERCSHPARAGAPPLEPASAAGEPTLRALAAVGPRPARTESGDMSRPERSAPDAMIAAGAEPC